MMPDSPEPRGSQGSAIEPLRHRGERLVELADPDQARGAKHVRGDQDDPERSPFHLDAI
jgi:hypothetical protein